jgi:hypothetical protein
VVHGTANIVRDSYGSTQALLMLAETWSVELLELDGIQIPWPLRRRTLSVREPMRRSSAESGDGRVLPKAKVVYSSLL